jgi:hypothetical protein
MEYSKAKKIREKSFGTLLAEHEGGLGSSLKSAISQKTQAKMTGMQEKFDPMNIAKFMTFGSNWAPAMLGKLTGRKQSSVDYFSGVKRRGKGTAEKLGKVDGEEGGGNVLSILQSIESLLHKTREDDKLKFEKDKNFEEERNTEKARRHKELMEAITGKAYKEKKVTTATKIDDKSNESPGLGLTDLLGGAAALSTLTKVLSWFASGFGLTLLGIGSVAALFALLYADKNAEETNKGIQNAGATDGGLGAAIQEVRSDEVSSRKAVLLREAYKNKTIKAGMFEFKKQGEEEKAYLTSIGFDDKTGLTQKDRDNGFNAVDEDGNPYLSKSRAKETAGKETNVPKQEESKNSQSATPSGSSTTPVPVVSNENKENLSSLPNNSSSAESLQSTPQISQALTQAQKENLDLNLPQSKSDSTGVVNNNVNNVSKNGKPKSIIPLVRNNEETLQRLIFNSTRVV